MSPRLDSWWSGSFSLPGREFRPLEAPGLSWRTEIRRIGLFHPQHGGIDHFSAVDNADFAKLLLAQGGHIGIRELPQIICVVAEIFQAQPNQQEHETM
jgi:hypothetical protein